MDNNILQALAENTAAMNRLLSLMEAKETRSEWVDPEEAAGILGLNVTKSGEHRKRINAAINKGVIKTFIEGRPYKYWRSELEQVARSKALGKIHY